MEWTAIAAGVLSILGAANVLLTWRSRGDLAELKLAITEKLTENEREIRTWAESEFARKETVAAQLEGLKATR